VRDFRLNHADSIALRRHPMAWLPTFGRAFGYHCQDD
jgi:hypothetical protein